MHVIDVTPINPRPAAPRARHFRHKLVAGLLATFLGFLGAHAWYMGRRRPWLITGYSLILLVLSTQADSWWDNPAFFLLLIPAVDGFISSAIYCLTPDEAFDQRYNSGQARVSRSGLGPIFLAIANLLIATIVTLSGVATIVLYIWTAVGWLDGYVL
ncbi:hypothetical protein ANDA3_1063 [plant metagenome]|uniref:Uncharacterized protein n=1 Tax=plant metagenome TaxID=1297885 RepID=A0A484SXW0_9ZZZZ